MTAAVAAAATPLIDALRLLKDDEGRSAERSAANALVSLSAKSSVENVALRWNSRGTLRRWHDMDDLCQDLRLVLLSRCVKGFRVPDGKADAEVARIFGRYVIVVLDNYLRDMQRHAGRNWTMHMGSIDGRKGRGGDETNSAAIVEDGRIYQNEPGSLDEREMFGAVRAALSERHAKIAYLLYEGKSWSEIGAALGENPGTLRDQMRKRAAPVLKALLGRWKS
jgi:DNA-binding CsgD family transcriptional regulator